MKTIAIFLLATTVLLGGCSSETKQEDNGNIVYYNMDYAKQYESCSSNLINATSTIEELNISINYLNEEIMTFEQCKDYKVGQKVYVLDTEIGKLLKATYKSCGYEGHRVDIDDDGDYRIEAYNKVYKEKNDFIK